MLGNLRILIVDDQLRARQGLKALLATWPQAQEVRETALGCDAMRLIQDSPPDVVFMDVRLPQVDGLQVTRLIKACWPQIKVIVLTLYAEYAADALAAGADAFLCKGEPPETVTLAACVSSLKRQATQPNLVFQFGLSVGRFIPTRQLIILLRQSPTLHV
jgi:YesN/AraC family two-component response regulator